VAGISTIYVERAVAEHPRTRRILARFPRAAVVPCDRYGEVFNRGAQSFRLQKRRPALILAEKHGRRVLETPAGYGIGGERNFYFSHMLNCLYDCRYCFLQGMYRSAHQVLFVNYEDFFAGVDEELAAAPEEDAYFFSGYDCDSLAFEGVTGFVDAALPFFSRRSRGWLELRTKSTRFEPLHRSEPFPNCVVAVSFTPDEVSRALEHGVPPVTRRLEAMKRLAERGWQLGLRFDPLIYHQGYEERYRELFHQIFHHLDAQALHSVSLGPFRLPTGFFHRLERLYPDEPLLAGPLEERGGTVSYRRDLEAEIVGFCTEELLRHLPEERFFPCRLEEGG